MPRNPCGSGGDYDLGAGGQSLSGWRDAEPE